MAIRTIKLISPSRIPRVAILVGCLHILISLWNISDAVYELNSRDPQHIAFAEFYHTQAIQTIIIAILFGLFGFLLIVGTYKKSHVMFLPWLILMGFTLVHYFVFTSLNLISMDIRSSNEEIFKSIAIIMVYFSIIGLCVYVWFVILQFYQTIRDGKQKPIQDDEEKLVVHPTSIGVRTEKPYPPAYFIPIAFSDPKHPPSQIKY